MLEAKLRVILKIIFLDKSFLESRFWHSQIHTNKQIHEETML